MVVFRMTGRLGSMLPAWGRSFLSMRVAPSLPIGTVSRSGRIGEACSHGSGDLGGYGAQDSWRSGVGAALEAVVLGGYSGSLAEDAAELLYGLEACPL